MNLNANLATPMPESLLPFYQNVVCDEKTSMRTDSGLTYNFPEPRKRQRNSIHSYSVPNQKINGLPEFVDRDMFLQMQQQQSDIDSFIAEHVSPNFMVYLDLNLIRLVAEKPKESKSRLG